MRKCYGIFNRELPVDLEVRYILIFIDKNRSFPFRLRVSPIEITLHY